MCDVLKLKYKVGEIEFEAEGPAEVVEQQRVNFMNAVLPAAVEAMVRTQTVVEQPAYIEPTTQPTLLEAGMLDNSQAILQKTETGFSRTSLASFLKQFDPLSELNRLAEKGHIMDAPRPENAKTGKYYMLTNNGIAYIESYTPKENSGGKKKSRVKAKKSVSTISKAYVSITADDLNTRNYPAVKSLSGAKEQIIMAMYIVTNEGKGEWFTVEDIIHLLINVFEVSADKDKVNGVFKRNKGMFASEQDPANKKALRKKLLSGAKDFAISIMQDSTQ